MIERTETTVTIDLGGGTVGVPMERVERIEKKRSPLDDYDERAAGLGPSLPTAAGGCTARAPG